ncbi:MAG TPA: aminodeoxychorismate synthase component I [Solirubrobacterales bacterium]|nr:aminodeoxychorismate synthase component I [Solirubrobacterales bacterium]
MPLQSQTEVLAGGDERRLLQRRLDFLPDPERAFVHIYGSSENAFWLDSSAEGERGRFSFMGDSEGPLGAVVTYDVEAGQVRVERQAGVEVHDESIFDYLGRELRRLQHLSDGLPFEFDCGFAGYFGYELKADCGAAAAHRAETPDATFVFADRLIAFDHQERHTYLLVLADPTAELHQIPNLTGRKFDAVRLAEDAESWIEEASRRLAALPVLTEPEPDPEPVELHLRWSPERYREEIETCKRYLTAGHSYEICLTNKVVAAASPDPLALYRALRRVNPAPFAAYLRFGDLAVLSSSPERFLAVDREDWVEARPIKGTSRRGSTPDEDARLAAALCADEKNRAENVTIVDLLRNDLGRVCELGSVSVPELMRVETYETVHQLVSSVRGRLRGELGTAECIRACFPPGSMTGAPKLRTMEILDELEGEARGPYSGAIGYLGLGGGCDLGVAIRTIVLNGESTSIGAGGAIVVDSDPTTEIDEMLLKAAAPAAALGDGASISFASLAAPEQLRRRPLSPTPTS